MTMGPMSLAALTGLPNGGKKSSRGNRKTSDRPGAKHLGALQRAHAAGDFKGAKRAALDYAKAIHQHSASESPEDHAELVEQESAPVAPAAPKSDRLKLAKLAAMRRKP
jgi:hypothetical protein